MYRFLAALDVRVEGEGGGRVRAPAFAVVGEGGEGGGDSVAFDPPYICKSVAACGVCELQQLRCNSVTSAAMV